VSLFLPWTESHQPHQSHRLIPEIYRSQERNPCQRHRVSENGPPKTADANIGGTNGRRERQTLGTLPLQVSVPWPEGVHTTCEMVAGLPARLHAKPDWVNGSTDPAGTLKWQTKVISPFEVMTARESFENMKGNPVGLWRARGYWMVAIIRVRRGSRPSRASPRRTPWPQRSRGSPSCA
jgi:hypothetical protein